MKEENNLTIWCQKSRDTRYGDHVILVYPLYGFNHRPAIKTTFLAFWAVNLKQRNPWKHQNQPAKKNIKEQKRTPAGGFFLR